MLSVFKAHMLCAHIELSFAHALPDMPDVARNSRNIASDHIRAALAEANGMKDRKRAGLCLKALHWIRLAA